MKQSNCIISKEKLTEEQESKTTGAKRNWCETKEYDIIILLPTVCSQMRISTG